jgi:hypothetical protein
MAKIIIKGMLLKDEKGKFKKDDGSVVDWRRVTVLDMDTDREISFKVDPGLKFPVEKYEKSTILADVDIKPGYGGKGTTLEVVSVIKQEK